MNEKEIYDLRNFIETKKYTVVLVPSLVPFKEKAIDELVSEYGNDLIFVAFDGNFHAAGRNVICEAEKERILSIAENSGAIVLLAPSMELISHIAEGEDSGFIEYLFLRSQLWGKKVSIYLDFDIPKYKRTQFLESVVGRIDLLRKFGVEIVCYCAENVVEQSDERVLITETDIVKLYESGGRQLICREDAIITPLGRDKANELRIEIIKQEVF